MLKMFHTGPASGGTAEFWEGVWEATSFDERLQFCDLDPLGPLIDAHTMPGDRLLEGGCGHGSYVAHHQARGVHAVGLDFARANLAELRRVAGVPLLAGDVAALPFRDGTFDVYYSGGVVEHLRGGPYRCPP